jgi:transposase-like protein
MAHVRGLAPERRCDCCGASFRPRRDQTTKGRGRFCSLPCANGSRANPIPADAEIVALYRDDRLSIKEIATKFGAGTERIRRALVREGVELRPSGWRTPGRYRTVYAPSGERVAEHRLVTEAPAGMVVHHINGRSRDNDPANLALLTRSEHAKAHKQLQEMAFSLVAAGLIQWKDGTYICCSDLERLSKHA